MKKVKRKLSTKQIIAISASGVVAIILICLLTDKYILGSVGSAVASFFRGLFGLSAYTFFISAQIILAFLIANKRLKIKSLDKVNLIVMYCILVGLVHTITSAGILKNAVDYSQYLSGCFNFAESATFGGAIAGIFIYPLAKTISLIGCYLFLGVLLVASAVFASVGLLRNTGKGLSRFFVQPVKDTSNDLYVANASGLSNNLTQPARPSLNNTATYYTEQPMGQQGQQIYNQQNIYKQPLPVNQQPILDKQILNNETVNQQIFPPTPPAQTDMQSYNKLYQDGLSANSKIISDVHISPIDNINIPQNKPPKFVHNDTSIVVEPFNKEQKNTEPAKNTETKPKVKEPPKQRTYYINNEPIIDGDALSMQLRQKQEQEENAKQEQEKIQEEKRRQLAQQQLEESKQVQKPTPDVISTPSFVRSDTEIVSQEEFNLDDTIPDIVVEDFPYNSNEYSAFDDDQDVNCNDNLFIESPIQQKAFKFPPIDLLDDIETDYASIRANIGEYGRDIVDVLEQFGISATIQNTIVGPTVTCFELELAQGVAISRVERVATDIARGIGAEEEVRIIPQIAGKKYFGIEVPNKIRGMIGLKHVLSSPTYKEHSLKSLTFGLGVDISGNQIVPDLADMPHLLIAGATGSGKSICMNGILISLMMKYTPQELRFILIDPKQVEFTIYRNSPHLLTSEVITNEKHAVKAFDWLISEMNRRYTLFNKSSKTQIIKDIVSYNKYARSASLLTLPRIVLVVDELSQLMSYDKNSIDDRIKQLSQLARSAGIHLIIATQRPSIDVITGTVKSNFTCRIALKLKSSADARTIMEGADPGALLGDGDMLYIGPRNNKSPIRLQGSYASNSEIERIIMYLRDNNDCEYDETIRKAIFSQVTLDQNRQQSEKDIKYYDALGEFINKGKASVSMLQSIFSMGYNRAKRIVDIMASEGLISEEEDSTTRTRKVLISRADYEKLINN